MNKLLDALWPTAQPESDLNPPAVFQKYYDALSRMSSFKSPENNARLLEFSRYLYEDQERRWQNILARANPTVTAAGLGFALFGGLATQFENGSAKRSSVADVAIVVLMLLAIAFLLGALIDALRVYGPAYRHGLDPTDLIQSDRLENVYFLTLSRSLLQYATENFKSHNRGLALVSSSQRRLRNGFVLLTLVAVLVFGLHIWDKFFSNSSQLWIL